MKIVISEKSDHTDIDFDHEVHLIPVAPQANQGEPADEAGIETRHRLMVKLELMDEHLGEHVGEHLGEHVGEHLGEQGYSLWPRSGKLHNEMFRLWEIMFSGTSTGHT